MAKVAYSIGTTLDGVAEVINLFLGLSSASLERVTDKVKLTSAIVASGCVDTNCVDSTNIGRTLIQIIAAAVGVSGVAFTADTLRNTGGQ